GYGYELKKFLLNKFKIVAVVASWAEPWFHFASVNTVFTILERCDEKKEIANNVVRFVKLNKKLDELIPYPDLELDESNRWHHIDKLVSKIENSIPPEDDICSKEDDDFRIRYVKQNYLSNELEEKGKFAKWGVYIRAPEIYFEIMQLTKEHSSLLKNYDNVLDIRRGYTTGINDFFYLEPLKEKPKKKNCIRVKNSIGWFGDIEKRFLKPVIKSPKESNAISINTKNLKSKLFMCGLSKSELKKSGCYGALKYIEASEKNESDSGLKWPNVPSVKNRKYWWFLGKRKPYPILMQMVNNDRFLIFQNEKRVYVDHNLFELNINKKDENIIAALLNSSMTALNRELISRINLGDGATKTEGVDWSNNIFIIDFKKLPKQKINKILSAFEKIKNRPILSIKDESKMKDRQALDKAILEAIGLNPKEYLPRIYKGLIELVDERLSLPKMRKKLAKIKVEASINEIKKRVEQNVLPDGLKIFPEAFLPYKVKTIEIPVSSDKMKISNHFFGKFEIVDEEGGKIYIANNIDEANYIICAQRPNTYLIKMPGNTKAVTNAIINYEKYINEIYEKLIKRALSATHDHNIADRIALEILVENGYTGNFELD
ncbi:MAG: hypothetical protein J7K40_12950, partial [candidate division Zixibacteria bacterium]|nr:hypothetical protein [candidate division Zixibacteria bacterium]